MASLLMLAEKGAEIDALCSELTRKGFECLVASDKEKALDRIAQKAPDLVLVEFNAHSAENNLKFSRKLKSLKHLPVLALVDRESLDFLAGEPLIDDFALKPYDRAELALRVKRLLRTDGFTGGGEKIRCGDLIIDLAKCEVSVSGKIVLLTFKEYELLKFFANNKGRVFSRDVLLNKVWGYDYFGGDRTVDVHIRRLRSKIEDAEHSFIDTVRNMGYRFRKQE